jgi:hypothetical protein
MAEVSVQVPASVVPSIRDTVVLLFRATAEALYLSLGRYGEGGEPLREVRRHRERLGSIDTLLVQLGWPGDPVPELVEVSGPRSLLHDALHGAMIDAGERLAVAAAAGWRSEAPTVSVRGVAAEVIALDRLVRQIERREGS